MTTPLDAEARTQREQWAENEALFCDKMVSEYRGPLLDGWKKRGDYVSSAQMQVECLIHAQCWERMAQHLRQPYYIRLEWEQRP